MIRVRIAQCLCPARHCIGALTVSDQKMTEAAIIAALKENIDFILVTGNPWCAICGAFYSTWRYEVRWSMPFASEEAAIEAIAQSERDQAASRRLLDSLGLTFDSRRRRGD